MKKLKYLFSQEWFNDFICYAVVAAWIMFTSPMAIRYLSTICLPDWSVEIFVFGILAPGMLDDLLRYYRRRNKKWGE